MNFRFATGTTKQHFELVTTKFTQQWRYPTTPSCELNKRAPCTNTVDVLGPADSLLLLQDDAQVGAVEARNVQELSCRTWPAALCQVGTSIANKARGKCR